MPAIIGSNKPAATPAAPASSTATPAASQSTPPTPQAPRRATANVRDDEGVAYQEGDHTTARASSDPYPRFDSFGPWPSGNATYLCSVQKIVKWSFGTIVTFRVESGPERGRQLDWGQTEPANMDATKKAKWRSNLFGAYAAGGWPLDADATTGWPGWEKNSRGIGVPPYDQFFIHTAPDGVQVPVIIKVDTWTVAVADARPFVNAVRHYVPDGHSLPVQAPMPYHLPAWLADLNKWTASPDVITTKSGIVEVVKVDYKQIPFGHGGLKTMRDLAKGG